MEISTKILSDITVYMKYAKHLRELNRRETWDEIIDRNVEMHAKKHPEMEKEIIEIYDRYVRPRLVLPSMRSLQFAGLPIELNPSRIYNCSYFPVDDWKCFSEAMFLLLSGVGVGYSVQYHHVEKLPEIRKPIKKRRYLVADSIEGWADAVKVLTKAYFFGGAKPTFDFRDIRPKGALLVTSGGKAPGPEPLMECLFKIERLLENKKDGEKLSPFECHLIMCYIADAVLSGGIRRSAMISLFSFDDDEMLTCKFGNWWETHPELARCNNTAVILRNRIEKKEFLELWKKIEASRSGEPGFMMTNDVEFGLNPCAEISLRAFQFCNLSTINFPAVNSQSDLEEFAKAASFIGTLQASYTNFHYLNEKWKKTTEKEALIGVSMTGLSDHRLMSFDLRKAAKAVMEENERISQKLEINRAARCTCVKPEGTTSLVLGTSSGVHAWHSDYYIRRIRVSKNEAIYDYLTKNYPEIVEDDFFKPKTQAVISIPIKAPNSAITRKTETSIDLLERVKFLHENWIKPGHRKGSNTNNVSATVTIKENEWESTGEWLWANKDCYTALSFLPEDLGTYVQAPFEETTKEKYEELISKLREINLSEVVEIEDNSKLNQQLACSGNQCEII